MIGLSSYFQVKMHLASKIFDLMLVLGQKKFYFEILFKNSVSKSKHNALSNLVKFNRNLVEIRSSFNFELVNSLKNRKFIKIY